MRDVAEVRHAGKITNDVAREALELLEVDGSGLERIDRELLSAVAEKFGGGPVGLSTLAVALGEETDTIEDVYEPYLLQLGFLQRTPRGRIITELGPQARRRRARRREPLLDARALDPGMTGPLDELVKRIERRIEGFRTEHGLERAGVSVELADGSLHRLASISAEPGFGFITLCPHCDAGRAGGADRADRRDPRDQDRRSPRTSRGSASRLRIEPG